MYKGEAKHGFLKCLAHFTYYSFNDNLLPKDLSRLCHHLSLQAVCVTINHLDKSNLRNAGHLQLWGAQHELTTH